MSPAAHAELVTTLYGFLMQKGRIPDAWFAAQVDQTDRVDGDIDTLSGRIAQIRTWTFVANRPDWLSDPDHWQGMTREIENKLSDALHERLTERFVDRRTSVLMRRLRENSVLNTEIGKTGEVIVEGHTIGRLDGFTFAPDAAEAGSDAKALQAAAQQVLAREIDARAEKLGRRARRTVRADLRRHHPLDRRCGRKTRRGRRRAASAIAHHLRRAAERRVARGRADAARSVAEDAYRKAAGPLFELSKAEDITGIARGIAFQLVEALGVLERTKISAEMKDLDQPSRAMLRKYGVRFGAYHIYFPQLLKPAARSLASLLWAEKQDNVDLVGAVERAASGEFRPHLVPGRQGVAARCLSRARLPAVRRARGARRHSGAARRSDPPGAGLARELARRKARRRVRWPRLCGDAGDDLADGIGRRGFCLDPARARLPHGSPPAIAAEAGAGGSRAETVSAETPPVEATAESHGGNAGGGSRGRTAGVRRSCAVGGPVAGGHADRGAAGRRAGPG